MYQVKYLAHSKPGLLKNIDFLAADGGAIELGLADEAVGDCPVFHSEDRVVLSKTGVGPSHKARTALADDDVPDLSLLARVELDPEVLRVVIRYVFR